MLSTESRAHQLAGVRSQPVGPDTDYSLLEIAALAGMGVSTLYRMIAQGRGPRTHKRGRRTLVRGADYLRWHNAQQG